MMRLSQKIALTAILASTFFILRYIPIGFPIIGVSGGTIRLGQIWVLAASALFPPEISVLSVALGGGLATIINVSPPFYLLNFLPATIAALTVSLYRFGGEKPLLIYIPLLLTYLLYPEVGILWSYPLHTWFHLIGLSLYILAALVYRRYGLEASILLGSLSGQLTGTILFMAMYYPSIIEYEAMVGVWMATTPVYPVERAVLTVAAVVIYHAVYKAFENYAPELFRGLGISKAP